MPSANCTWSSSSDALNWLANELPHMVAAREEYERTGEMVGAYAGALLRAAEVETELARVRGESVASTLQEEINLLVAYIDAQDSSNRIGQRAIEVAQERLDTLVALRAELRQSSREAETDATAARLTELAAALEVLGVKYETLGGASGPINLVSDQTSLYRQAIEDLIDMGIDPSSEAVQGLRMSYLNLLAAQNDVIKSTEDLRGIQAAQKDDAAYLAGKYAEIARLRSEDATAASDARKLEVAEEAAKQRAILDAEIAAQAERQAVRDAETEASIASARERVSELTRLREQQAQDAITIAKAEAAEELRIAKAVADMKMQIVGGLFNLASTLADRMIEDEIAAARTQKAIGVAQAIINTADRKSVV